MEMSQSLRILREDVDAGENPVGYLKMYKDDILEELMREYLIPEAEDHVGYI